jgi:3-methyladenine DNA glycosylase AlkD
MGPEAFVTDLQSVFEARADAARAPGMRAYMKDQFAFFGLPSPERRMATKMCWQNIPPKKVTAEWLLETTRRCWNQAEREFQYAALDTLEKFRQVLRACDLEPLTQIVLEKAWWDSIDPFASHTVGDLVWRFPELIPAMMANSSHENLWRKRIAILHQLGYKSRTDTTRLVTISLENAGHESFWVRKSLGWAWREYFRTDPKFVQAFFETHGQQFSNLTVREALKHT